MNKGWSKVLVHQPNIMVSLLSFILPRKSKFDALTGLPDNKLRMNHLAIDTSLLARYTAVCEIAPQDDLPVLFPQVLVSPMQLALLSDRDFPLRMLGAVHKRNHLIQKRPISCSERLDLSVQIAGYRVIEKGIEVDLVNHVNVGGELVWESVSTYFVHGDFGKSADENPPDSALSERMADATSRELPETKMQWYLAVNKGRQYAKVTGDYNPIHVSAIAARLFGFKRDIAHGFYVLAASLEKNKYTNAKALNQHMMTEAQGLILDVEFKGPNFLGSELTLRQNVSPQESRLELYCGDNPKPTLRAGLIFK